MVSIERARELIGDKNMSDEDIDRVRRDLRELSKNWNYDASVKKVSGIIYKSKNLTEDMLYELWEARERLSSQGLRDKSPEVRTWSDYCLEIGSQRRIVNRWLEEKLPERTNKKIETPELPKGKYRVIYADPAWEYDRTIGQGVAVEQYDLMPLEDICNLPIQKLAAEDSILFLWGWQLEAFFMTT